MKFIGFVVILSLYLFVQVRSNTTPNDDGDILDIAKAALEELEKVIGEIVKAALGTLDGLESTLKTVEEAVLNVAEGAVDEIGDLIFEKLNQLKQEANDLGIDIIDCTEDRENDIKQLFVTFLNKTGGCAVGRIDEVLDSLEDIVVDVESTNDDLKRLTRQLDTCGSDDACIAVVILNIAKAAGELPDKVEKDVQKAQKGVNDLVDYLFECEHDYYNELQKTSQEIFNGIVECVKDKISHPSVYLVP